MDKSILNATSVVEWKVDKPPANCTPRWVYIGRDEDKIGAIQIAIATTTKTPSKENLKTLHSLRKGRTTIQLVVGVISAEKIWIFGPDERTQVVELPLNQGIRQLQSALDESNSLNAYTRLGQFRRSIDTTSLIGVTNSGLFASYHIRENVPKRSDWKAACERAKPWLSLRADNLIKALGFQSEKTAGNALVLSSGTPKAKAIAILLDDSEQFDSSSPRHTGISPVAFGLNVAARQGVNWLFVLRKDQIRVYPAKDGVGVGQKGQVETYLEVDLAAIDQERAGLLALIFSAEALEPEGTINDLLDGSSRFASQLSLRLRERIYDHVVPELAKSVAEQLREQKTRLDSDGLDLAYKITLRILFRLLFQAYAEDRGLLPAGRNEGYDANSLKTIAQRIKGIPAEKFGKSKTLWLDLVQVWNAIDEGNDTWSVPAYNGGLFGTDPEIHPEGALIEKIAIQDDILGPVLQHLLIDVSEDDVLGPVDFRSLSVREFGTIYEGLLESSLSVATENLTVDSKGAWVPAGKKELVLAKEGDVYFHSASGERKATGSYFTPSFIVDYVIEKSLSPALDAHLSKIKSHLDAGDQAAAARDFFDFRVADLAMGSGHFLAAAVDRIEAKMRAFLAEKETQVPGINAQLHRLSESAKLALGKDESAIGEIESAALLRRQIARRCIYGLDINPLAVELARLALWIHTFVPGLPMSNLDHGLVCSNSLTGIGTIEEALETLQPDIPRTPLKKGHARPVSVFEGVVTDNLLEARELLIEVANSDEANKSEVKQATKIAKKARATAESAKNIFDCAIAARFGLFDARNIFEESQLVEIGKTEKVKNTIKELQPAHMPYLFPEVFTRDDPGFDVLIGNPPWEELVQDELKFWTRYIPGLKSVQYGKRIDQIKKMKKLRPDLEQLLEKETSQMDSIRNAIVNGPFPGMGTGDPDLYKAFAWRNFQLLRKKGYSGLVMPRSVVTSKGSLDYRKEIIQSGRLKTVGALVNSGRWIFEDVDPRYQIALLTIGGFVNEDIELEGPWTSLQKFRAKSEAVRVKRDDIELWSENFIIPAFASPKAYSIYRKIRQSPTISNHQFLNFGTQTELSATLDRNLYYFEGDKKPEGALPILGGRSFDTWICDTGEYFGWVKSKTLLALDKKRLTQIRRSESPFFGQTEEWATNPDTAPWMHPRIAYRAISRSTDTRTIRASIIPAGHLLSNSAGYFFRKKGPVSDEAFLLAVLNSRTLDWTMRHTVEMNVNPHTIRSCPIPEITRDSTIYSRIIGLVCDIYSEETRLKSWLQQIQNKPKKSKLERENISVTNEIEALVALAYGLDTEEVSYIYANFHEGWEYRSYLEQVIGFMDKWKDSNE